LFYSRDSASATKLLPTSPNSQISGLCPTVAFILGRRPCRVATESGRKVRTRSLYGRVSTLILLHLSLEYIQSSLNGRRTELGPRVRNLGHLSFRPPANPPLQDNYSETHRRLSLQFNIDLIFVEARPTPHNTVTGRHRREPFSARRPKLRGRVWRLPAPPF
jgi:hypothetical protein